MNTTSFRLHGAHVPGLLLIAAGLLAPLAMLVHPTAQGADTAARLSRLAEISSLSRHVHLAAMLCIVVLWLSLASLARRWPDNGWVGTAMRLYALGAAAMLGAALVSGFLIGDYLQRALPVMARSEDAAAGVLLAFSANQILAGCGTVLLSAGIVSWSVAMLRQPARAAKVCGAYGVLAGLLCLLGYASGRIPLDVPGMTLVVVAHSVWYGLLGAWSLRSARAARI